MNAIEHDALKRLVKATEAFESGFGQALFGMSGPKTKHGEIYVEYLNGARYAGRDLEEAFPTPDQAITTTFSRLSANHPSDVSKTLYWRIKPEIDYSERRKGYITYCRFLVSDKKSVNHG